MFKKYRARMPPCNPFRMKSAIVSNQLVVVPRSLDNIILNGDFETGDLTNWEVTGAEIAGDGYESDYCIKIPSEVGYNAIQTFDVVDIADVPEISLYLKNKYDFDLLGEDEVWRTVSGTPALPGVWEYVNVRHAFLVAGVTTFKAIRLRWWVYSCYYDNVKIMVWS